MLALIPFVGVFMIHPDSKIREKKQYSYPAIPFDRISGLLNAQRMNFAMLLNGRYHA